MDEGLFAQVNAIYSQAYYENVKNANVKMQMRSFC